MTMGVMGVLENGYIKLLAAEEEILTMKLYLVTLGLLTLLQLGAADVDPAYFNSFFLSIVECMKEQEVGIDKVVNFMLAKKIPDTKELKCLIGCYLQKMGYHKNGKIVWDKVKDANKLKYTEKKDVEKADIVVDICRQKEPVTGDVCEVSNNIVKCFITEGRKIRLDAPTVDFNDFFKD